MQHYNQVKAMFAITKASLRGQFRSPSAVLFSFAFPFIFILVFGFIGKNTGVPVFKIALSKNCDTVNALFDSIKKYGYQTRNEIDDIEAEILVNDKDWCALIRKGEHRVSALASLNYSKVPIRLYPSRIIRYNELNYYNLVFNNYFTIDGSRDVFNRIMKGGMDATLVNVVGWP